MTLTYDFDIEMARKLVKKIGQELAADPEFASSTIQPLKMQGVDSFGDSGIVLRIKLMTKPGEQFGIKRKAFVMIKKAFDDNGIKLAVPTVQVAEVRSTNRLQPRPAPSRQSEGGCGCGRVKRTGGAGVETEKEGSGRSK